MTKIVVTQPMEFTQEHKARLNMLGDVSYYDTFTPNGEERLRRCEGADVICTGKFGFKEKWAELRDVFVSLPSVGVGFLEPSVLKEHGVTVSNSPGCNRHAVSEWIIGMMITMFRRLNELTNVDNLPANQPPEPTRGLAYKKVAILGKGNIGSRVGAVCEALEMQVTYFTRGDNLLDCVKGADVVVDTLSLNPSTVGLLGKEFFAALKPNTVFITVTSEEIVDTDAMLHALDEGNLAFVASDAGGMLMGNTTDPFYQKLFAHPKVLVTPHVSYNTDVTHKISNDMMIDNVEAWIKGEPINVVGV